MDNSTNTKESEITTVSTLVNSVGEVVNTIQVVCDTIVKDKKAVRENFKNHQENISDLIASLKVVISHLNYLDTRMGVGNNHKLRTKLRTEVPQCFPFPVRKYTVTGEVVEEEEEELPRFIPHTSAQHQQEDINKAYRGLMAADIAKQEPKGVLTEEEQQTYAAKAGRLPLDYDYPF